MKIIAGITRLIALAVQALREIFDETAYQRFLLRNQLPPGKVSYAEFCRDHYQLKARRPKCC